MKWLILRGFVREQRHWGDFRKSFEDGLRLVDPDAEVFCLDFPGFGTESDRFSPTTISEIVEDLRSRWQKLSPGSDWSLLAISLGGMVAMEWCAKYPKDFHKLTLINSSSRGISPFHHRVKPQNYKTILSLLLKSDTATRETTVLKMTSNLTGKALEERAKRHLSFAKPVRVRDAFAQFLALIKFHPPKALSVPLLVLVSRGDQLVDPACSEAIAKHFKADIQFHPDGNHDLPTDDPQWIIKKVIDWAYVKALTA